MLDFEGSDESFQETFMATFSVTYSDMFVSIQTANLIENGEQIPVTLDNRKVMHIPVIIILCLIRNTLICILTGC